MSTRIGFGEGRIGGCKFNHNFCLFVYICALYIVSIVLITVFSTYTEAGKTVHWRLIMYMLTANNSSMSMLESKRK